METPDFVNLSIPIEFKRIMWSGGYMDLGAFMPNIPGEKKETKMDIVDGVFTKKETQKRVRSINDCTMCFLKYIAVIMQRKIEKTPPMISYMTTILQAAKTSPGFGWRKYDEQFRLKLAHFPHMAWDMIDNHLWLACIINQQPEFEPEDPVPLSSKPNSPFSRTGEDSAPGG